jgi:hypothetical protein
MRRCPRESEGVFFMSYVQGEGRTQGSLFPLTLEELIPDDHVCRVIDAFVARLDMAGLGFERAEAAETGRPGYPRFEGKYQSEKSGPSLKHYGLRTHSTRSRLILALAW